ncbi:MAG TPA: YceI family protein [bacterium]|nr:YceI family protein [bacterium]
MSARLIALLAAVLTWADLAAGAAIPQRFVIVPEESQVIYRVREVFLREGNRLNTAVGTSGAVRGEIVVDRAAPLRSRLGPITVDLSTFRSDSARRDQAIRERWLESARYPIAEFRATAIEVLSAAVREGQEVRLRIEGQLTVRETTRAVAFQATLTLQGDLLRGVATGTIRMTDFGVEPPHLLGILRAEDEVRLEFRFTARRAP